MGCEDDKGLASEFESGLDNVIWKIEKKGLTLNVSKIVCIVVFVAVFVDIINLY